MVWSSVLVSAIFFSTLPPSALSSPSLSYGTLSASSTDEVGLRFSSITLELAKEGIKRYGERAVVAMANEFDQLDGLNVFSPEYAANLTRAQKRAALKAINLIKEKRCGKIKGRTVADGRKQRKHVPKSESSSPALSIDALLTTLIIDAKEGRSVATSDVAGAFLKADMPDYVLLRVTGEAVDALLRVNAEKYAKYVVIENGVKVLYLRLNKAMYGTIKAAILWYTMFKDNLEGMGFKLNPYDLCVANKMVNGHQLTVGWYVDDVKMSHMDDDELTKLIELLEEKFGKMNVTRGNKHIYLGLEIELRDGKVYISMKGYLEEAIQDFGEPIDGGATSPAAKNLMVVNADAERLDKTRQDKFHSIVQKLLHVSKRARLDIQVAVGFLCTRVQKPDVDDWKKLRRLIKYLNGTLDMPRILSMESLCMNIFVDASHAAHPDMRGQTGGCVSMGYGVVHGRSAKQHINTKSSTETELVGVSDYLPYPIWLLRFLEAQGYKVEERVLHQDNESTIKLLKNGQKSAGQRSRHIDIRYFWITDRLKKENISVKYCPTEIMLADFFTKPLQGRLFKSMRNVVQGLVHPSELQYLVSSMKARKERVEAKLRKSNLAASTNRQTDEIAMTSKQQEQRMRRKVSFYEG